MNSKNLLEYILPSDIIAHFDVIEATENDGILSIHLDEKNVIPPETPKEKQLESKGFMPSIMIQDFPIRGKETYLKVRRRVWRDKETGESITRKWELYEQGTSYTKDFAAFLKELIRQ